MSDVVDFKDLGLVPGRKVTFTVDGERVVEDPPMVTLKVTGTEVVTFPEDAPRKMIRVEQTGLDGVVRVGTLKPPTFEDMKRALAKDIVLVAIDAMLTKAKREQLGVPGCRCGCSDGKPRGGA
jgi:hypothetical protein